MTPTNDNRPAEFDARLVGYLPGLRYQARRYPWLEPEDAAQQTIILALTRWRQFRPDGGIFGWLKGLLANVAQAALPQTRETGMPAGVLESLASPPTQEYVADIKRALDTLPADRRDIILSYATGESAMEIAHRHGVSGTTMTTFINETQTTLRDGGTFTRRVPAPPVVRKGKPGAKWRALAEQYTRRQLAA
jgi:DNA-directed RNA polymerase specialized sigma24 family protein